MRHVTQQRPVVLRGPQAWKQLWFHASTAVANLSVKQSCITVRVALTLQLQEPAGDELLQCPAARVENQKPPVFFGMFIDQQPSGFNEGVH
mmetsp:Transcript_102830/g.286330  ORF Transcript_102830/g.286330 Transcript_102830/m.286330 type:complete len:91 (+) Transcript_102830:306-578(+)